MSYKSTHTGAQVDEAVSKVLNGEVGGGADWNAQEGEDGYVENRTHYIEKTLLAEQCSVGSVYEEDYENLPITFRFSDGHDLELYPFVNLRIVDDTNNEEFDFKINLENKRQQDFDFGFIYVHEYDGSAIPISIAYLMHNPVDLYEIKYNTINENYLPKTVLKTTPQKLSNADKNQARANLGISTPDWNAQIDEDGYIKNKPFYISYSNKITEYKKNHLLKYKSKEIIFLNRVIKLSIGENIINSSLKLILSVDDDKDYWLMAEYGIGEPYDSFTVYAGVYIKKLDEYCLPDTIAHITDTEEMTSILYADLVNLRDNSKLKPGHQYRIVDYTTTTTQENTLSADHQFDVIVTADDVNVLNEKARAIHHEGDTYFSNSDLNAWEIWYSLDNDIARFDWAQEIELSPLSKRKMIRVDDDDYTYIYLRYPEGDENGKYAWVYDNGTEGVSIKEYVSGGEEDLNINDCIYTTTENPSIGYSVDGSVIGSVIEVSTTASGKGVIYYMKDEWNNECPYDFKNIMFRNESGYNYYTFNSSNYGDDTIDGRAYNNVIKPYINIYKMCINNIRFGNNCNNNTFGNGCYDNSFGNDFHSNTFGNGCYDNSFGNNCHSNSFGNYCYSNSFGNYCYSNTFGNDCNSNNFGNNCNTNTFGNRCDTNTFGNYCYSNSFGNSCVYNKFGNNCYSNRLGDGCIYNYFGSSAALLKNYYRYIVIDNGNSHITLNCTATTSSNSYFQNVRIGLGVSNTFKTISSSETNQSYETLYRAENSKTLKPDGTSF